MSILQQATCFEDQGSIGGFGSVLKETRDVFILVLKHSRIMLCIIGVVIYPANELISTSSTDWRRRTEEIRKF